MKNIKLLLFVLLSFFLSTSQLFSQSSQLDSLFNAFDRYDNSEMLKKLGEPRGVKSNFFRSDLAIFRKNYSQE